MMLTVEDKRDFELFLRTLDVKSWDELAQIVGLCANSVRGKVNNRQPLETWEFCEWVQKACERRLHNSPTSISHAR